ncbi:MAG: hypothetical protein M3O74_00725 [Pseudomonadota bacterium]|jgi:hypothetical protein|uniref:Transmembrane protein n=2 Tax=Caballeronia sordidicola TaxID=196367 RepID=A0A242MIH2_CABSO|nr:MULTISPECIES: hypothetical protein [Burkholderiaceae]AMH42912.1 hypothetical protein AXG89_34465 [Burkholderia sp. PAMC 26561]MDP9152745.1 hypothetical protein [Pseudomonadota bacterium]OTP70540.1 hypothetical protein PAMC26577_26160 [Caballeronia sordidicola]
MTPERFRRLTEAYGAMPEHWPQAERADAQALVAGRDPEALAALADAGSLDLLLSAHTVAAPGNDLIRRIVEASPVGSSTRKPAWKKPEWWLSGAGFVGVGVAGIAAGVLVISLTTSLSGTAGGPPSLFDQTGESTVFNSSASDWSDQ